MSDLSFLLLVLVKFVQLLGLVLLVLGGIIVYYRLVNRNV